MDYLARTYKGAQGAIVRKVHADMESTVIQSFRKKILRDDPSVRVFGGETAAWFDYTNGSRVWVGGLDRASQVLSGERDFVYVNQAEELMLADWETLTTRTTGRAGNMPQAYTFGDCNPRGPSHWILERARAGKLKLLKSEHRDNPLLFDEQGKITEQGEKSLAILAATTGLRNKRLFGGLWVQAEGVIYEEYDESVHCCVKSISEYPYLFIVADDGFTNPAALLWIGIDLDGRLHVFSEWYHTGKVHSEIAEAAKFNPYGVPVHFLICDSAAAALVAQFRIAGLKAQGHKGEVKDGIDLVISLLKVQGDGRPRLTFDPGCVNLKREIEEYAWKPGGKEEPVKVNDHALDALRYGVHFLYAPRERETVEVGQAEVVINARY